MRILILFVVLVVVGCVALPLGAAVLDGSDTGEGLVVPAQILLTAAVGGLLGRVVLAAESPGIPESPQGPGSPAGRPVLVGAVLGVAGALVGVAVFFLLLNGFDGA
ncbi:hypothetical protein [Nocardioides sp. BYT-33-1]|uniref:hypothetical protein n=1 Tax=Nocardioides sp. BYT-33-1 TaxID=3416952 RepID=UPI003F5394D4